MYRISIIQKTIGFDITDKQNFNDNFTKTNLSDLDEVYIFF